MWAIQKPLPLLNQVQQECVGRPAKYRWYPVLNAVDQIAKIWSGAIWGQKMARHSQ